MEKIFNQGEREKKGSRTIGQTFPMNFLTKFDSKLFFHPRIKKCDRKKDKREEKNSIKNGISKMVR